MRKFVKWLIPASVLVTTVLLFRFVFFIGYVSTESMEPTIHKGSYILGCRIFGELKVGDIIVFEYEGKQIVKRVAAVGGDVVNHMGCNLTVPEECFYVLGDNGDNSWDSRYWESPFLFERNIIAVLDTMFTIAPDAAEPEVCGEALCLQGLCYGVVPHWGQRGLYLRPAQYPPRRGLPHEQDIGVQLPQHSESLLRATRGAGPARPFVQKGKS